MKQPYKELVKVASQITAPMPTAYTYYSISNLFHMNADLTQIECYKIAKGNYFLIFFGGKERINSFPFMKNVFIDFLLKISQ